MSKIVVISKFSKLLTKKELIQILKLKKTFWPFNLISQMFFFKKNYYKFDINNLLYVNNKLVGYNMLRKRSFFLKKKKRKYYFLDTLIVDKNQRQKKFGSILMNLNTLLIQNSKLHGMLLCRKSALNFYKKFGWKISNNKKIKLEDKNTDLVKLFFNKKSNIENLRYYICK